MTFSWKTRANDWANGQLVTATDFQDYLTGNLNYLKYRKFFQATGDATGSTGSTSYVNVNFVPTFTINQPEPNKALRYLVGYSGTIAINNSGFRYKIGVSVDGNDPLDTREVSGQVPAANIQIPFSQVFLLRLVNSLTPTNTVIRLKWAAANGGTMTPYGTWVFWYAELSTDDV